MNFKKIISFFGGLLITSLAYLLIMFAILYTTFSFAGETLTEKENRESFFFYTTIFVITVSIYIFYRFYKSNRKFAAFGIVIPILFAIYSAGLTGKDYFNNLNNYQTFDQTIWVNSKFKPFKMAKNLVNSKVLLGMTRQQIINKLGNTNDSLTNEKNELLRYWTDNGTWQLKIIFKNNIVSESFIFEEGLDL